MNAHGDESQSFRDQWVTAGDWGRMSPEEWAALPVGSVRTLARGGRTGALYLSVEKTAPDLWSVHARDGVPEAVLVGMSSASRAPRPATQVRERPPRRITRVTPATLAAFTARAGR